MERISAKEHLHRMNLLKQRGRTWKIRECLLSEELLEEIGECNIVVCREHTGGKVSFGCFLVDSYCRGVKDAFVRVLAEESDYLDLRGSLMAQQGYKAVPYEIAHNWIFGAIEFAAEVEMEPHRDFKQAKYILEDDEDERIPIIDLPFGKDGKHFLVANSEKELRHFLPRMKRILGEGNYYYSVKTDLFSDWDGIPDWDESDDEDWDDDDYFNEDAWNKNGYRPIL